MNPTDVGSGVVTGGWEYVTAAYVACWIVLLGYTFTLWLRSPPGGER